MLFVSSFYRWDYRGLERLRHVLQDSLAGGGRGVRPHKSVWSESEPVTLYLSYLPYLTFVIFELLPCYQTFTISILTCIKVIIWPDFSFEWAVWNLNLSPACGVENDGPSILGSLSWLGGGGVLGFLGRTQLTGEKVNRPSRMVVQGQRHNCWGNRTEQSPEEQELSGFSIPGYSHRS